jgi:hypothetical protein
LVFLPDTIAPDNFTVAAFMPTNVKDFLYQIDGDVGPIPADYLIDHPFITVLFKTPGEQPEKRDVSHTILVRSIEKVK